MIRNPSRLYDGCPPVPQLHFKLRLIDHFLLGPLGAAWDVEITSAYRSTTAQAALYALDEARAQVKAKGISQHVLAEAVDVVPANGDFEGCFRWCLDRLLPWQAILEYAGDKPECIHLSLLSEIETIAEKRLLFYRGQWLNFDGTFPGAPVAA